MMAAHEKFKADTLDELRCKVAELGVDVRFQERIEALKRPVPLGSLAVPNSIAIHPMEGCDGTPDGSPGELTFRRYQRFARGGAGLIWFEATAVLHEGRANPRQLWIHRHNVGAFAELVARIRAAAREEFGPRFAPVLICQLTHSGRYSRPNGKPAPTIAQHNPYLDPKVGIPPDHPLVSDEHLEWIEDAFAEAAALARDAGFDGVDVKSCHGYLSSELLGAHTREGRYGGPLENRTRFLRNVVGKTRDRVGGSLLVTCRLNVFDGVPYPYGFGQSPTGENAPDLTEPKRLVQQLYDDGMRLINISIANPYYNPHLGRPFDLPAFNLYVPPEHPLEGVARLFHLTREVQQHVPGMAVVGTGYSWLRQYLGYAGEANVRNGWVTLVGAGREAFAHPAFARELLEHGRLDPNRVCITCSNCTQIMRDGGPTGCVPRDRKVYTPIFVSGMRAHRHEARKPPWIADHV
jgi:2,4-dienoyl-CoA reductase-like NADH-dependent reductase (Old Yellow Enzyme family)